VKGFGLEHCIIEGDICLLSGCQKLNASDDQWHAAMFPAEIRNCSMNSFLAICLTEVVVVVPIAIMLSLVEDSEHETGTKVR